MSWANTYIMIIRMLILMALVPNLLENVYRQNEHILQQMFEHIQCVVAPTLKTYLKQTHHCLLYI